MCSLTPLIGGLIELARGIEAHSVFHTAGKQIKQMCGLSLLIKLTANLIVSSYWIFTLAEPKCFILCGEV